MNISLYIHWPFCVSKCPYCDFYSGPIKEINPDSWIKAYLRDMLFWYNLIKDRKIKSIFFGGGTPSLMNVDMVQKIIEQSRIYWGKAAEVTLEMNPTTFEAEKCAGFKQGGINRISVGIQSLNDEILTFLGRNHSAEEAIEVISNIAKLFDSYSFDLIYAHQYHENKIEWEKELEKALNICGNHISLYQLEYMKGTPFYHALTNNSIKKLPEDKVVDLFNYTSDITKAYGFSQYEISNFAKNNAECLHNLVYWDCEDYIGIGPGSHSRITLNNKRYAFSFPNDNDLWLNFHGGKLIELDDKQSLCEILLLGLRKINGIKIEKILKYSDESIVNKIKFLQEKNIIKLDNDHISVIGNNILILDSIIEYLL